MKKLGLSLIGFVVLLIAAVLIGPSFVDWNAHKDRLTAEARKITGRELSIEGDISLALLPAPALSAAKVRLANIQGGSAASMMELEALKVRVALLPLLQGQIQIESVSLVKPIILAEVLPDGRKNWEFAALGAAEPAVGGLDATSPRGGMSSEVRLDLVTIENGTLIYRDAISGREERAEGLNAEIVAQSLSGPFSISGDAVLHDLKTGFAANMGRIVDDGATPLNLNLELMDAGAKGQFSGALSLHKGAASLRGRVKAEGANLAALARVLSPETGFPPALATPFSVETEVSADSQRILAADAKLRLGEMSIDGDVEVQLDPSPHLRVKLSASRLNLDKLLQASSGATVHKASQNENQSTTAPSATVPSAAPGGMALPTGIAGSLEVAVDALVFRDQVVRQVRLNLNLAEGQVEVEQARALLPGGSDVSLSGTLKPGKKGSDPALQFDGRVEAASDNLRGIFVWLGADVAAVPAERLRRMSLTSRVSATRQQVTLNDMDLRVDVSRATGGIAIALRERLGLGIGLEMDKINLDAYLPAGSATAGGAANSKKSEEANAGGAAGGAQVTQSHTSVFGLAALGAFDANLDLKLGHLIFRGVPARELRLDATLQQGMLTLREARFGDIAGSSALFTGSLAELTGTPTVDGTIEFKVADPVRLAKLAKVEAGVFAKLGAFELTSDVKGSAAQLSLDAKLTALDGRFAAAGTVRPQATPFAFDAKIKATHPDLSKLAGILAPELGLGPKLGRLDLAARVSGTPVKFQVADVAGQAGPAVLSGGLNADLSGPKPVFSDIDIAIAVKHPDVAALISSMAPEGAVGTKLGPGLGGLDIKGRIAGSSKEIRITDLAGQAGPAELTGFLNIDLGGPSPVVTGVDLGLGLRHRNLADLVRSLKPDLALNPALGGVDLKAHITGTPDRIQIDDLAGKLGQTDVAGTLGADLSGAKPALTIDLVTGPVPLGALMAQPGADESAGAGTGAGGGANKTGAKTAPTATQSRGRWSGKAIDVSALNQINAEIKLKSKALVFDKLRLNNAVVDASLVDGLLDLRKANGVFYDGALAVTGKIDARKGIAAGFGVTVIELNVAKLLRDVAESDRVSGPLNVNASLSTSGRSEAELISALSGKGDLGGTLNVKTKSEEQLGAALLGILGKKVGEIRGIADTTNLLFNSFGGAPAALKGSFTVDRGVVTTQDTQLDGDQATALTQGTIDLPAWQINTRTDVTRAQDSAPYVSVDLRGPLDKPNPRISGQVFQRQPQAAPSTSGPQPSGPQPSGQDQIQPAPAPAPEKLEPKDILKKGLKDLLKGLNN